MNLNRKGLFAALVASAALSVAACDATQFNSFNDSFKEIKVAGKTVENATLPAAAMATNMAVVELMNGLSDNGSGKSGIIAAGGGNIIAAGGGNYSVLDAATANTQLLSNGFGFISSVKNGKSLISASFNYGKKEEGSKTTYSISKFYGIVSGFLVNVDGSFVYDATKSGSSDGRMTASATGSMRILSSKDRSALFGENLSGQSLVDAIRKADSEGKLNEYINSHLLGKMQLTELSFDSPVPMKGTIEKLGSLKMLDGYTQNVFAASARMENDAILASGKLSDAKGNVIQSVTIDENGIKADKK